jgi:hypothetical protein
VVNGLFHWNDPGTLVLEARQARENGASCLFLLFFPFSRRCICLFDQPCSFLLISPFVTFFFRLLLFLCLFLHQFCSSAFTSFPSVLLTLGLRDAAPSRIQGPVFDFCAGCWLC